MNLAPSLLTIFATLTLTITAGQTQTLAPSLDSLIEKFRSDAPQIEADVEINAWIEPSLRDGEPNEVVITLRPGGETKLNADPGITVTPAEQIGIEWQVAVPHRHQDQSIAYFDPPAMIRMPFKASDNQPAELLVEYAYCFVDYQCFFGEERLRVAMPETGGPS